jgi:hypothetical protein
MSQKIVYDGTVSKGKVQYLRFREETTGQEVEVPVDRITAQHFLVHFEKLIPTDSNPVERGNEGDSI